MPVALAGEEVTKVTSLYTVKRPLRHIKLFLVSSMSLGKAGPLMCLLGVFSNATQPLRRRQRSTLTNQVENNMAAYRYDLESLRAPKPVLSKLDVKSASQGVSILSWKVVKPFHPQVLEPPNHKNWPAGQ